MYENYLQKDFEFFKPVEQPTLPVTFLQTTWQLSNIAWPKIQLTLIIDNEGAANLDIY